MAPSNSLQIPAIDSPASSSRHYTPHSHTHPHPHAPSTGSNPSTNPGARPISVAAPTSTAAASHSASASAPPPSAASSRRHRASHNVVSPTQHHHPHAGHTSHHPGGHGHGHGHRPEHGHASEDPNGSPSIPPTPSAQPYPDVYAHPAAVAYAAAHPRRTIPKFGPYLLLQTLGEGEFGKVKLGLHSQWGEEVAVKLIRRGNVDSSLRMSKVEREIEVLKTLKHPNIVRLYDVIETDKYIGIILEYASGGELFDHILAHRYLKERDAAKLFSQLISGVWYIHQKKIVHRDLKLENLLLDRNRNVIITDFGFANRFEHKADDLMQTSCGSPCYAAPELVISEGLYVGSAVDIWSCGVILYAMLAGYLPFDDDPANPDGDNINLLYKYIVSTPLSFPEYISPEARDLLGMMLVPDPSRRTSLEGVMRHPWLGVFGEERADGAPSAFGRTVEELERAAMEQHQVKRLAYQRQMRANAQAQAAHGQGQGHSQAQAHQSQQQYHQQQGQQQIAPSPSRTQSHRPDYAVSQPPPAVRSHSTQPEYLYDSSSASASAGGDQSLLSSPVHSQSQSQGQGYSQARGQGQSQQNQVPTAPNTPTQQYPHPQPGKKAYGSPQALGLSEDDPFAGPPSSSVPPSSASHPSASSNNAGITALSPAPAPAPTSSKEPREKEKGHKSTNSAGGGGGFRHTIQVEYDEPGSGAGTSQRGRRRSGSLSKSQQGQQGPGSPPKDREPQRERERERERRPSQSQGQAGKPLPASPSGRTTPTQGGYRSPPSASGGKGRPAELALNGANNGDINGGSGNGNGNGSFNGNFNGSGNGNFNGNPNIPPVPLSAPPSAPSSGAQQPTSAAPPLPTSASEKEKDKEVSSTASVSSSKETHSQTQREKEKDTGSMSSFKGTSHSGSGGSGSVSGHRKGKSSVDRMGLGKIFGIGSGSSNGAGAAQNGVEGSGSMEDTATAVSSSAAETSKDASASKDSSKDKDTPPQAQKKTSRRNTLTVMVEPFSRSIRGGGSTKRSTSKSRNGGREHTPITSVYPEAAVGGAAVNGQNNGAGVETPIANAHARMLNVPLPNLPHTAAVDQPLHANMGAPPSSASGSVSQEFGGQEGPNGAAQGQGMQASTSKAKKVMQWFRSKSKGRESLGVGGGMGGGVEEEDRDREKERETTPTPTTATAASQQSQSQGVLSKYRRGYSASSSTVNQANKAEKDREEASSNERDVKTPNNVLVAPPVHVVVTTPTSAVGRPVPATPTTATATGSISQHSQQQQQRTASVGTMESTAPSAYASSASATTPSFVTRFRNSVTLGAASRERRTSGTSKHAPASHASSAHPSSSHQHAPAHPYAQLRIHHGAVDQTTITTRPPPEVMAHVRRVLESMGVEAQMESEYKVRCVRVKRRKDVVGGGAGVGAGGVEGHRGGQGGPELAVVTMVGSAASGGVDKRGLPLPSPSSFASTGGSMLRGLLMRRQSSQVSAHSHHTTPASATGANASSSQPSLAFDDESSVIVGEPLAISTSGESAAAAAALPSPLSPVPPSGGLGGNVGPAYGDPSQDAGDEVRFSVELTRIDRLNDTYSLDIRRLKGNLRSYKFLYDTLRDRADLSASKNIKV